LPGLAQLYAVLLDIVAQAKNQGLIRGSAQHTAKLIEAILLGDAEDAKGTLGLVRDKVAQMQQMLGATPLAGEVGDEGLLGAVGAGSAIGERPIKRHDVALALEFAAEAVGHMDCAEASLLALEKEPHGQEHLHAIFRGFHSIKGAAGLLELRQIGALAHAAENLLERARQGRVVLDGATVDLVLQSVDLMRRMITAVSDAAKTLQAPPKQEALDEMLRRLAVASGVERVTQDPTPPAMDATPASAVGALQGPCERAASAHSTAGTVKISAERLDALMDAVGQLTVVQGAISRDFSCGGECEDRDIAGDLAQLSRITRSLRDVCMAMRTVPIRGVFQKMARLARDLARKAGKEIEFVQIGPEVELDHNVVERLSDALVHMVRNAIDHGIEGPQERQEAGKPRAGRVQLKAARQAQGVVVEVGDDGRGLNKSEILAKAVGCGIIQPGQALADEQTFSLIFHPGLSTAPRVTDVSGRGVGMDVVRKNVEALGGRVEIASEQGRGSRFTIHLPAQGGPGVNVAW